MKIGIVLAKTPAYSETFFISKIEGLQSSGFEVTLFVQDKQPDFGLCPVKIAPKFYKRNPLKQLLATCGFLFYFLVYFKPFWRYLKLEQRAGLTIKQSLKHTYINAHILAAKVDWLHFGFATLAVKSEQVAKAIGAKMAVSFRGFDLDIYPLKHPGCYKLLWEHVDKIHSISNYLLQKAYTLGLPKNIAYQIITPAVDSSNIKDHLSENHKPIRIVTIARLQWIKGLHATLEALALLKAKHVDFKYEIIGDGPDYEALKFTIHQLGLLEHVELVGKLPHKATIRRLSEAAIYVQYSYSEGFCNAVLEAQAMGLLCVVSDGGALPENVIHGKTGWVVPKGQPQKLAETIEQVISLSEEQKDVIKSYTKNRVQDQFNLNKQVLEFKNFYEATAG